MDELADGMDELETGSGMGLNVQLQSVGGRRTQAGRVDDG